MPICTASRVPLRGPRPIIRLIQPLRASDPGAASSTSSIAEKCERLGTLRPVAWTAASSPDFHKNSSGSIEGCRPNVESAHNRAVFGTAVVGRAA